MSIVRTLAPVVGLSLFWLLLVNDIGPAQWTLGLVLSAIALSLTRPLRPSGPPLRRLRPALGLALVFARDVVAANIAVARAVLTPRLPIHPHVVRIPLELRERNPVVLLASMIALTPDTVVMEIDFEHPALVVHVLVATDDDSVADAIKRRYEPRIREIFGC